MIRLYGYSDDVVVIEPSWGKSEEIQCYDREVLIVLNNEININFRYGESGPTWAFFLDPHNENVDELPEIRVVPENAYSFAVELDYEEETDIYWELN